MRNRDGWRESKFTFAPDGRARASRNPAEVGIGSRFIADVIAPCYAEALRAHARGRLLDLGCGKAPLYGVYRSLASEIVCIDWVLSFHDNPYLDLEHDLNQPLPLASESFDTILLTDVLEHMALPDALWAEITRLLRPGGVVIVGVPFFYMVHEAPYDFHRYTEYKLRHFCAMNGLAVEQLRPYGGAFEVLADISAKLISGSGPLSAFHLAVTGATSRSPLGAKLRDRTARSFPLGYLLVARK
jgi:SAM-dependent methyltransferase